MSGIARIAVTTAGAIAGVGLASASWTRGFDVLEKSDLGTSMGDWAQVAAAAAPVALGAGALFAATKIPKGAIADAVRGAGIGSLATAGFGLVAIAGVSWLLRDWEF